MAERQHAIPGLHHLLHLPSALLGALAGTVIVDKYTFAIPWPLQDKAARWIAAILRWRRIAAVLSVAGTPQLRVRGAKDRTVVPDMASIYIVHARGHALAGGTCLQRRSHFCSANRLSALRQRCSATVVLKGPGKPGRPPQLEVSSIAARIQELRMRTNAFLSILSNGNGRSWRVHAGPKRERTC